MSLDDNIPQVMACLFNAGYNVTFRPGKELIVTATPPTDTPDEVVGAPLTGSSFHSWDQALTNLVTQLFETHAWGVDPDVQ